MGRVKLEKIFEPYRIDDLYLINNIRSIRNLIDKLQNETQLSKYITNELLVPKGIEFSKHFDEEDSKITRVKCNNYGIVFYIDHSIDNIIYAPKDCKYKYADFKEAVTYIFDTWFQDIVLLNSCFELSNSDEGMSRDIMIVLIKKYHYIPFTHFYFDQYEFIYSKKDAIYQENGSLFKDWDSKKFINGEFGLGWETGWKIYDFENWYDKLKEDK